MIKKTNSRMEYLQNYCACPGGMGGGGGQIPYLNEALESFQSAEFVSLGGGGEGGGEGFVDACKGPHVHVNAPTSLRVCRFE